MQESRANLAEVGSLAVTLTARGKGGLRGEGKWELRIGNWCCAHIVCKHWASFISGDYSTVVTVVTGVKN